MDLTIASDKVPHRAIELIKVKDHLPSRPSFEKEVMDINRRAQSALKMERSKSFSILPEMRHGLKARVVKSLFWQTTRQLERLVHAC